MNLDQMLALLPDNNTGEIDAADLRAIITDLYGGHSVAQVFGYLWATGTGTPAVGRVLVAPLWSAGSTTLRINETTDDGQNLIFTVLDSLSSTLILSGANGGVLRAKITGPSVDLGTSRDVPITVTGLSGSAPINGEKMAVVVQAVLP